ncbi:MAG: GPW/gp25 family protein [Polyangiaceae bacterium]
MFLERKFARRAESRFEPRSHLVLPDTDLKLLPELVYDVVSHLQILLSARRNYAHVAADFGFSPIHGRTGLSSQVELLKTEIPRVFNRYEPRFTLAELEAEMDDDGVPFLQATGTISGLVGKLALDIAVTSRRITRVAFGP